MKDKLVYGYARLSFSLENVISPLKSSIEIFYTKKKKKEKRRREKGVSLLVKLNCNVEEERAYKRAWRQFNLQLQTLLPWKRNGFKCFVVLECFADKDKPRKKSGREVRQSNTGRESGGMPSDISLRAICISFGIKPSYNIILYLYLLFKFINYSFFNFITRGSHVLCHF